VGLTDYCANNGIQIFIFIDMLAKCFIVVTVLSCLLFKVDGDFEFLILCMAVFLHNFWKGKMFYGRIERYLNENKNENNNF